MYLLKVFRKKNVGVSIIFVEKIVLDCVGGLLKNPLSFLRKFKAEKLPGCFMRLRQTEDCHCLKINPVQQTFFCIFHFHVYLDANIIENSRGLILFKY